ncbi:MAG: hypothetical protein KatS3mg089_0032 [Patescibacteria group bacterium]|nr:MAG: hypothetical protein KatS3mg089_0032 [Patescibacteria group bacterium]
MKRFLFALFVSLYFLITYVSFAQNNSSSSANPNVALDTQKPSVDYTLPYPGLLPDNPLYPLKMLRDRIVLFLINDSVKRTEFYLLQADKRLQAGVFLYRKDPSKISLSLDTLGKSEQYFTKAVKEVEKVKQEKKDIGALLNNLQRASLKHEEVLLLFEKSVPQEYRKRVRVIIDNMRNHQNTVNELISSS